jgi:hypothetical protein
MPNRFPVMAPDRRTKVYHEKGFDMLTITAITVAAAL